MAQISRHKLIAPVCKVGSLGGGGAGWPQGSRGISALRPLGGSHTHSPRLAAVPLLHTERGGLAPGGWLGPEPQRGVLGRGAHPGRDAPLS